MKNKAIKASLAIFLSVGFGCILQALASNPTDSNRVEVSNRGDGNFNLTKTHRLGTPAFVKDDFEDKIRPLLGKYCIDCHAPGEMKHLDFLAAKKDSDVPGLRDVYIGVVEAIDNRSMPPRNSDQPSDAERKLVTEWIKKKLELKSNYFDRIAQYVVEIYQDKKGNLWFGTMNKGAARYDGKTLKWFSGKDGLPSNAVPSFAEDKDGNLWVGTQGGVCKFDGKAFIKMGREQGLPTQYGRVRADKDGILWAGMNRGIFRFNGSSFSEFKVPLDKKKITSYAIIPGQVMMALHDKKGNLWFKTDGAGAFKFDGKSFTQFTTKDGLCSNNVTSILEDKKGNIWFTCIQSFKPRMTGDGGLCRYDGKTFTKFPKVKGLSKNDIYTIYETKKGDIWIGATHVGVYHYDGKTFTLFNKTDRTYWTRHLGLQSMLEDKNGTLWFGFSGGLFRFNGKSFYNITKDGPWK